MVFVNNSMTQEKQELEAFFKHIQQSLKLFTLEELNEVLVNINSKRDDKQKDKEKNIDIIVDIICKEYKIAKHDLIYSREKRIQEPRTIAFCILHTILDLPIRYIASKIFFLKWHNTVGVAIKYYNELDPSIQPDKEFMDKFNNIKTQVNKKINTI